MAQTSQGEERMRGDDLLQDPLAKRERCPCGKSILSNTHPVSPSASPKKQSQENVKDTTKARSTTPHSSPMPQKGKKIEREEEKKKNVEDCSWAKLKIARPPFPHTGRGLGYLQMEGQKGEKGKEEKEKRMKREVKKKKKKRKIQLSQRRRNK